MTPPRPNQKNEPKELITIFELSRRSGLSEQAIRGRISSGHWIEGTHYFRRGRRIMMDAEACGKWFMGKN